MGMGIPLARINIRRLLKGLGLLVVLLLAAAFGLGLLSMKRTSEMVSEDFQQQQLILAKTTARQIEDGLEFLRRELKILDYSPAIQYLEKVAWANRMQVSFNDLSKLGVTAIERIDIAGANGGHTYILDAGGPRVIDYKVNQSAAEVAWAKDPANRGRIRHGPVELEAPGGHKVPFFDLAMPVYEQSVDESHPQATGIWGGVLLFKIDASQFTGHYCAGIRSGRTGYCWVLNSDGIFLYHPETGVYRGRRLYRPGPAQSADQFHQDQRNSEIENVGRRGRDFPIHFRLAPGCHRADGKIRGLQPCQGEPGWFQNLAGGGGGAHR